MKKNFQIIVFILISQCCFSQIKSLYVERDTMKAIYSSYIFEKYTNKVSVWNVNSKYVGLDPGNFELSPRPKMYLKNVGGLVDLLKMHIKPYLKEENIGKYKNFQIGFHFDRNGNILELFFTYPREVNIPVTILEILDREIKEVCYIQIKGTKKIFEGVPFHYYPLVFSLEGILKNEQLSREDIEIRLWW